MKPKHSNATYHQVWLTVGLVVLLLLLHVGLCASSVLQKSSTFDEIVHLTSGYTYWKFNDYRFQPENGNFPQRWVALSLPFQSLAFPEAIHNMWDARLFFNLGNNADRILLWGRVMTVFLSMALGLTVFLISRRLCSQM